MCECEWENDGESEREDQNYWTGTTASVAFGPIEILHNIPATPAFVRMYVCVRESVCMCVWKRERESELVHLCCLWWLPISQGTSITGCVKILNHRFSPKPSFSQKLKKQPRFPAKQAAPLQTKVNVSYVTVLKTLVKRLNYNFTSLRCSPTPTNDKIYRQIHIYTLPDKHALTHARTRTHTCTHTHTTCLVLARCALDMATKHFYKMIVAAGKRSSEDIGPKEREEEETNA